jgi:menaquinone-dependent protoporphyrinogen IX oxidase
MKYGQIAESHSINEAIHHCFDYISKRDAQKFVKKFREQPHNCEQIMNTFRELILGAYLASKNFHVQYEKNIVKRTPDWCLLNEKSEVIAVVELTNFHANQATQIEINEQVETKGHATYWSPDNTSRLYGSISEKIYSYKDLVSKLNVSYVVALSSHIEAAVLYQEEFLPCFTNENGLFHSYPELSGALYFENIGANYPFRYTSNPYALRAFRIPDGVLSCPRYTSKDSTN